MGVGIGLSGIHSWNRKDSALVFNTVYSGMDEHSTR